MVTSEGRTSEIIGNFTTFINTQMEMEKNYYAFCHNFAAKS